MKQALRDAKKEARSITVEVIDKLPKVEDVTAVMVRVAMKEPKLLPPAYIQAIEWKIKEHYGDHVLVIVLGEGEEIEQLDTKAMNLRGWVRLPGTGIHEN